MKLNFFFSFFFIFYIIPAFSQPGGSTDLTCSGYQKTIGSDKTDRAYDVAVTLNNEYFIAGYTQARNDPGDIAVSKMSANGTLLWSKVYGGDKEESIRKISATKDGGLLVIGQTKSYSNSNGDIYCFKINGTGQIIWERKYGVGSANGDLGMDITETSDGGFALTGILNVHGSVADFVVIRLDNNANVVWSKRYDRGDGEDGVGIVQNGDELVVACDLQNNASHYDFQVMKIKLSDGNFIQARKFHPQQSGLFNPYIYRNPSKPGYIISGHTINYDTYSTMKHTIITLNEDLELQQTQMVTVNPQTNDFFTGFIPLNDGSFIGCATSVGNADGFIYRIRNDNTVMYAKKLDSPEDRKLYRLAASGERLISVGSTIQNGQEDVFIINSNVNGQMEAACSVQDVSITIEQPVYTSFAFTWPSIQDVSFSNVSTPQQSFVLSFTARNLCPITFTPEFEYQHDACDPRKVQFTTQLPGIKTFEWQFGDGQIDANAISPLHLYAESKDYEVLLKVETLGGCIGYVQKSIKIELPVVNIILNSDTTICYGTSLQISAMENPGSSIVWTPATFLDNSTIPDPVASPTSDTKYRIEVTDVNGCITVDSISINVESLPLFSINPVEVSVCAGDTIQLVASGGNKYRWLPADLVSSPYSASTFLVPAANTSYQVIIEEDICHFSDTLQASINLQPKPVLNISKTNDIDCYQSESKLMVTGADKYFWNHVSSLSNINIQNPVAKPLETTTYYVKGVTADGCFSVDSIKVNVTLTDRSEFFIPTAFTPNRDRINDCFGIKYWGPIRSFSMEIFNRWGEIVHATKSPSDCWNGVFKGVDQPAGTYVYIISAKTLCGDIWKKGTITLIR